MSKKIFVAFLFINAAIVSARDLSVLTIGNSFSQSLDPYFKKVVSSVPGNTLHLEFANFGGCELKRHWAYISKEESEPGLKIYDKGKRRLEEILKSRKWDIVTIQQASHESWMPESYQPYAKKIYDYVKKHAPNAKVMIQQTWSYRADSPRLAKWGFDNAEMFDRLKKAYAKLAAEMGLEQIPTGYAVELARAANPVKFKIPTDVELASYRYPDLPRQSGDIVGKSFWKKGKDGSMKITADCIHLNSYGNYLQACVWFASLYGEPAAKISFVPDNMSEADAKYFREIADKAVSDMGPKN